MDSLAGLVTVADNFLGVLSLGGTADLVTVDVTFFGVLALRLRSCGNRTRNKLK